MARNPADKLVERYLAALDAALGELSDAQRRQILQDVADHIRTARSDLAPGDVAGVRTVLEQLGDPAAIAAEAGVRRRPRSLGRDAWVPWLLLLGGFLFGAGWLLGLVLLWTSPTWRLPDKLLGTFVWPGGWFGVALTFGWTGSSRLCSGVPGHPGTWHCVASGPSLPWPAGVLLLLVGIAAPLGAAVHLERRRRLGPAARQG
ncbi:MAG: hypothetical protein K6V97_10015 [Actinomycetia bacterium]|nr:hypothetical protein [Actinomycetes bacterium]